MKKGLIILFVSAAIAFVLISCGIDNANAQGNNLFATAANIISF